MTVNGPGRLTVIRPPRVDRSRAWLHGVTVEIGSVRLHLRDFSPGEWAVPVRLEVIEPSASR
jgi:hypothetical protein